VKLSIVGGSICDYPVLLLPTPGGVEKKKKNEKAVQSISSYTRRISRREK